MRKWLLLGLAATVLAAPADPAGGQLKIQPRTSPPAETSPAAPAAPAAAPAAAEKKAAADARREAADLPVQFRKKKGDDAARKALVDRAIELGPAAAGGLLAAVQAELAPLQARYRQAFYKEAQAGVRAKLKDSRPQDVENLRQKILATVKRTDLTKEMVVQDADPALKELREKLLLEPEGVLSGAEALRKMRDEAAALAQHAQRLADALPAPPAGKPGEAPAPPRFEAAIRAEEEIAVLAVIAPDDRARKTLADNLPLEPKIQPEEARGLRFLNQVRLLAGLQPCQLDTRLCEAARDHSKDMVEKNFFAHESPVAGKRLPWDRAKNFGTSAAAENIANGQESGADTIMQWWHSPGHLKNMMDSHGRAGLGKHQKTWTLMLGG
ncbi:MAG: CAP domain-containing protein [Planctomycetes bacterium]|nr:CAP domain-containing protein [Planctomycetota bacterium]